MNIPLNSEEEKLKLIAPHHSTSFHFFSSEHKNTLDIDLVYIWNDYNNGRDRHEFCFHGKNIEIFKDFNRVNFQHYNNMVPVKILNKTGYCHVKEKITTYTYLHFKEYRHPELAKITGRKIDPWENGIVLDDILDLVLFEKFHAYDDVYFHNNLYHHLNFFKGINQYAGKYIFTPYLDDIETPNRNETINNLMMNNHYFKDKLVFKDTDKNQLYFVIEKMDNNERLQDFKISERNEKIKTILE